MEMAKICRRSRLERSPKVFVTSGERFMAWRRISLLPYACEYGIEGIVSKLANSHYESKRNRNWLKVKCAQRGEA
jgi:ATP-dependent DNA ligase